MGMGMGQGCHTKGRDGLCESMAVNGGVSRELRPFVYVCNLLKSLPKARQQFEQLFEAMLTEPARGH
jgi:hypothetical protein